MKPIPAATDGAAGITLQRGVHGQADDHDVAHRAQTRALAERDPGEEDEGAHEHGDAAQ